MKDLEKIRKKLTAHKAELTSRFGISSLGIFGSYARGEQKENSDIDILARYEKMPGYFDYIRAENYLSELLGIKVELTIDEDLNPVISRNIANEVVFV